MFYSIFVKMNEVEKMCKIIKNQVFFPHFYFVYLFKLYRLNDPVMSNDVIFVPNFRFCRLWVTFVTHFFQVSFFVSKE